MSKLKSTIFCDVTAEFCRNLLLTSSTLIYFSQTLSIEAVSSYWEATYWKINLQLPLWS